MTNLIEYYRMNNDAEGNITFSRVKEEDIKICGKTIDEIITILNGIEVERLTEIQMTMENLSYLFKKVCEEQNRHLQTEMKKMFNCGE